MTDNTIVFHEPVRPGDVLTTRQILRSVSRREDDQAGHGPLLGHRRRVPNQNGALVGVETYTGFGYRRG